MKCVEKSAEHYFLTELDRYGANPDHWQCFHFLFSGMLKHSDLVADRAGMAAKIAAVRGKVEGFAHLARAELRDDFDGGMCVFTDLDVFIFARAESAEAKEALASVFKKLSEQAPKGAAQSYMLEAELRQLNKLADEKLLSKRRFDAYEDFLDDYKVGSLKMRRARHDAPVVLVVEDDRFTAHYASTILSSKYELILCKDGEEAIQAYIEHAPAIALLDIHLPGLSGHDVLQAVRTVDPEGYVVMLSVDTVADNIVNATKLGAKKFVKKPFTKERLLETVNESPFVKKLTRSDRAGSETMF